jgi:hypothetical protein
VHNIALEDWLEACVHISVRYDQGSASILRRIESYLRWLNDFGRLNARSWVLDVVICKLDAAHISQDGLIDDTLLLQGVLIYST